MTHKLDTDDFFIHRVQGECAALGLNFFLIEPIWAERYYESCARGELRARALLNMHSEHHLPEDIYHRLVKQAHAQGTRVIDPPEVAEAAFDKARMHARLVEAGYPVPWTMVVPREAAAECKLTAQQREALGSPFVIKPSHGYGRRGVLLDARGEGDLARSMAAWANPAYLLQRKIEPAAVNGEPAYWRVFFVFGEVLICWWNCHTDRYREASEQEIEEQQLGKLAVMARGIAALSGMNFFSSEIARTADGGYVLIDYVNDQCHMLSQSADPSKGVPDAAVERVAKRLVRAAAAMIRTPMAKN